MLVIGQDAAESVDEHVLIHPDRIALLSGRPVLIVPRGHDPNAKHAHSVIAWDGSRAAARALSDSLGLLEAEGQVTVLTIGDDSTPRPISEVMQHLGRHGIRADHDHIAADPGLARALLAYCREKRPGLLVMGAYEHSKFREDFLGGVTARVLRNARLPVLLSH
jgi:nucleotide-binding universal stress UspA family protein